MTEWIEVIGRVVEDAGDEYVLVHDDKLDKDFLRWLGNDWEAVERLDEAFLTVGDVIRFTTNDEEQTEYHQEVDKFK